MAIAFRCTGCRCRIHVAERRAGTSVSCPRCQTRVVVPPTSEAPVPTGFEGRDVERSLASLQRPAGGTFAEESFELPATPAVGAPGSGSAGGGVTLPRWAVYAGVAALPIIAVVAFLAGCLWMTAAAR